MRLSKCKGVCCTFESHYGAPITWDEVNQINLVLSTIIKFLPKAHRNEIEEGGFFEVKQDEPLLRSIDNRACVFVYYDDGIAKCAMEKAFFDGKSESFQVQTFSEIINHPDFVVFSDHQIQALREQYHLIPLFAFNEIHEVNLIH